MGKSTWVTCKLSPDSPGYYKVIRRNQPATIMKFHWDGSFWYEPSGERVDRLSLDYFKWKSPSPRDPRAELPRSNLFSSKKL